MARTLESWQHLNSIEDVPSHPQTWNLTRGSWNTISLSKVSPHRIHVSGPIKRRVAIVTWLHRLPEAKPKSRLRILLGVHCRGSWDSYNAPRLALVGSQHSGFKMRIAPQVDKFKHSRQYSTKVLPGGQKRGQGQGHKTGLTIHMQRQQHMGMCQNVDCDPTSWLRLDARKGFPQNNLILDSQSRCVLRGLSKFPFCGWGTSSSHRLESKFNNVTLVVSQKFNFLFFVQSALGGSRLVSACKSWRLIPGDVCNAGGRQVGHPRVGKREAG